VRTLEEWRDARDVQGWLVVLKDEGTVYVLHRKTKEEVLEQLRLYERDNLFEETQLKEVGGHDLANKCNFEAYPDGSFVLIGIDEPHLPQMSDDALLNDMRNVLEEFEFDEVIQPLMERIGPHIEGLMRERNGAEKSEQLLEEKVAKLELDLAGVQRMNSSLENEVQVMEAEADDWMEMAEEAEGKAEEMQEDLTRKEEALRQMLIGAENLDIQNSKLKTRIAELETLVENGDKIMSEEQLHNSHDDLPSAKELKKASTALNKAAKNLILSHCNACNKTLKNPKGLAQHLRDTKCGLIDAKTKWDQQQKLDGARQIYMPPAGTEAKWVYQRDALKWNALSSSFETLVRYSALAFAVYQIVGIFA
jgi:hypothetical protein